MASVGKFKIASFRIENAEIERYEHHRIVAFTKLTVDALNYLSGRYIAARHIGCQAEQVLGARHEHGRCHALARDVADQEGETAVGGGEEIIKIAANLARGFHHGKDFDREFRRGCGEIAWNHAHLQCAGSIELALKTGEMGTHLIA